MTAQTPRRPTAEEIQKIREQIRQNQAEREALAASQALLPWRQRADSPDPAAGARQVLVRLDNQMNFFHAVWTFTPLSGNPAPAVRMPLCWRGEQWIALPPGDWQVGVALGRPGGVSAFRIQAAPIDAKAGQVFELILNDSVEKAMIERERAAVKAAENKEQPK